jgi:hypothetical protein
MKQVAMGYTIVELMIFLAVSGALFVMATILISGKQEAAGFSQAIRDFSSKVEDVISDVGDGYFPATNQYKCTRGATYADKPVITAASSEQGTNIDCTFLGKVLQFSRNSSKVTVYSLVGLRERADFKSARSLDETNPLIHPFVSDSFNLSNGVIVSQVVYRKNNATKDVVPPLPPTTPPSSIGSLAFVNPVASSGGSTELNVIPIAGTTLLDPVLDPATRTLIEANILTSDVNPYDLVICLLQGNNGRRAALVVGLNENRLATTLHIGDVDSTAVTDILGVPSGGQLCPSAA